MSQMTPQARHPPVVAHFDAQKLVNPSTLDSASCTFPCPRDIQGAPLDLYAGLHPQSPLPGICTSLNHFVWWRAC